MTDSDYVLELQGFNVYLLLPMSDKNRDKIHIFHPGFFQHPCTCFNGASSGIDVIYQDYGMDIRGNVSCCKCLFQVFQAA